MKILWVLTTPLDISGITNNLLNYYKYIDKSDMTIDFVAPNRVPDRIKNIVKNDGGSVFELRMRNRNPFKYIIELKNIIKKNEYDIVHAHGNSTTLYLEMLAAKLAGVNVRIAHSRNTTCKYKKVNVLLKPLFKNSYNHAFACGEEAGKWLFDEAPFTVIRNGNDIEKFSYNENFSVENKKKYNLENKKIIGHVGSFNEQKNHQFLIEVFYELLKKDSSFHLILIGDGPLISHIKNEVSKKGMTNDVTFTGKINNVNEVIQSVDLMILPSLYEGLPNVVVEWQIASIPSIISNNVSEEVKLTNLVEFKSLDDGPISWAEKIFKFQMIDKKNIKEKSISDVTKAGYNIEINAVELKQKYEEMVIIN